MKICLIHWVTIGYEEHTPEDRIEWSYPQGVPFACGSSKAILEGKKLVEKELNDLLDVDSADTKPVYEWRFETPYNKDATVSCFLAEAWGDYKQYEVLATMSCTSMLVREPRD